MGYDWGAGMSQRAVDAYDRGFVPASKVKGVPSDLVLRYCSPVEWHHTSKFYNATEFYDPHQVRVAFGLEAPCDSKDCECEPDERAISALAEWKAARKQGTEQIVHENQHVEWIEWTGSRRHPRAKQHEAHGATIRVKGQFATVELPDGRSFRKKLDARGFSFEAEKE